MSHLGRVAALLCLVQMFGAVLAQTEHKVHNIVLYPHKHSWCKTTPIQQEVAHTGCDSLKIQNNVCVGGCFSYSIPRTIPGSPGEVQPYCDSCQPSTHSWRQVVLNCTSGDHVGAQTLSKMVQIIDHCTCAKCKDHSASSSVDDPSGEDRLPESPQLTQTLDLTNTRTSQTQEEISQRTLVLLRELGDEEGNEMETEEDQVALREIMHNVEDSDHKINGATLKEFVRRIQENDHININVKRLQQVLEKLENPEQKASNEHRHHQHLIEGPHHSLVLSGESEQVPERYLNPTLDVPSHLLRPAHEGSELSYHNNLLPTDEEEADE